MIRDRARKGDEAHDKHNLVLARKQYITAYERMPDWRGSGPPFWFKVPKDLIFDILSKITTASLELHDYESVLRWAEEITKVDWSVLTILKIGRDKKPVEYAKETFYLAYYSMAVVYQKQGKIGAAIQAFEDAFLCNGGCHATYYQLEELKRRSSEACKKDEVLGSDKTEEVA